MRQQGKPNVTRTDASPVRNKHQKCINTENPTCVWLRLLCLSCGGGLCSATPAAPLRLPGLQDGRKWNGWCVRARRPSSCSSHCCGVGWRVWKESRRRTATTTCRPGESCNRHCLRQWFKRLCNVADARLMLAAPPASILITCLVYRFPLDSNLRSHGGAAGDQRLMCLGAAQQCSMAPHQFKLGRADNAAVPMLVRQGNSVSLNNADGDLSFSAHSPLEDELCVNE